MAKVPTWLLSLLIILLWGTTFPAIKLQLQYISPLVLAGWRVLPAGIIVCLWALIRKYPRPSRRLWAQAAISALLNVVMLYGGQMAASAYLSPGVVAGLIYLQPVLVTLFARIWLDESLSARKLTGILTGLAGVALVAVSAGARASVLGIIFATTGALGWALGTVYLKAHQNDSPIWFVGLQFLLGGTVFTIISFVFSSPASHWTPLALADLLFIMVGGTAGAWVLFLALLQRGQASRVSTFLFGVPAVASLIGIIAFHEPLNIQFVAGFVAVSLGILLVNGPRPHRALSEEDRLNA